MNTKIFNLFDYLKVKLLNNYKSQYKNSDTKVASLFLSIIILTYQLTFQYQCAQFYVLFVYLPYVL